MTGYEDCESDVWQLDHDVLAMQVELPKHHPHAMSAMHDMHVLYVLQFPCEYGWRNDELMICNKKDEKFYEVSQKKNEFELLLQRSLVFDNLYFKLIILKEFKYLLFILPNKLLNQQLEKYFLSI